MYLALEKYKNDCKIFNYSGTDFCPLKPKIARSSIRFRLNALAPSYLLTKVNY